MFNEDLKDYYLPPESNNPSIWAVILLAAAVFLWFSRFPSFITILCIAFFLYHSFHALREYIFLKKLEKNKRLFIEQISRHKNWNLKTTLNELCVKSEDSETIIAFDSIEKVQFFPNCTIIIYGSDYLIFPKASFAVADWEVFSRTIKAVLEDGQPSYQ